MNRYKFYLFFNCDYISRSRPDGVNMSSSGPQSAPLIDAFTEIKRGLNKHLLVGCLLFETNWIDRTNFLVYKASVIFSFVDYLFCFRPPNRLIFRLKPFPSCLRFATVLKTREGR